MNVPKPRKLPSGAYNIQLRLDGESISITRAKDSECIQEAQLIKAEYLAGKRKKVSRSVKEMTLSQAIDLYISDNKAVLSPSTIRSYKSYQKSRFSKYQDTKLPSIRFQQMINDELSEASEKTVKNAWSLVHAALDHVDFPMPKVKLAKIPVKEVNFLQPEEIPLFLNAIKDRPYEIACLLMLHGLRLSEVKALQYEDIDLKKKTIRVHGAVVRGEDGMVRKKTNKNATSTRTVPIMIPRLCEAIKGHRSVFEHSVGIHPSVLLEDVKTACKRAGVTECGCHDLRRSFSSLCFHLQVSDRQTMQWGGWADYQTMHKVYIKLAAADETKARQAVEDFFISNANGSANASEKVPGNTGTV